jgi:hypothetical protein
MMSPTIFAPATSACSLRSRDLERAMSMTRLWRTADIARSCQPDGAETVKQRKWFSDADAPFHVYAHEG